MSADGLRVGLEQLRKAVKALDDMQAEVDRGEAREHWLDDKRADVVDAARDLAALLPPEDGQP